MNFLVESENFLLVCRNRYSEGMDDGQKTPHGHPDFHSYMKIQRVLFSYSRYDWRPPSSTPRRLASERHGAPGRLEGIAFRQHCLVEREGQIKLT